MIHISTRQEYDFAVKRGYEPLINWRMFTLDFNLRINIQKEIFGAGDFQKENLKFYKWIWERKIHRCEETGRPLHYYNAVHISHIISKGANRAMATDPRNVNILSFNMHNYWEFKERKERSKMNIYRENKIIIQLLKNDYNG